MIQSKYFRFILWLLCFQLIFTGTSVPLQAKENKSQLLLNESFESFEGNVPAGFTIFNKDGGSITFDTVDSVQKRAVKYNINNITKNLNFQYNFSAPVEGQLIFETKLQAEDTSIYFPFFQLSDSKRINCTLASLSGGKIKVGAENKVLTAFTPGEWYHLHFAVNLENGKMDVYLNGNKKIKDLNFWVKDKSTGKPKEVREVSTFKSYLKGQSNKDLVVYQDDIRIYTGTTPIFDPTFFEIKSDNPDTENPSLPTEPLPDYYENPSSAKIMADLAEYNPNNEHPRLFIRKADITLLKQKVQTDSLSKKWFENLKKEGTKIIKSPVGKYELPDGRRMPAAKNARPRIETTAMLYLLTDDDKYLNRAIAEIQALIAFPDWNHQNEFLNTAEMAAGIAIGYDWLYADLSDEFKAEIRQALIEKGLNKAKEAYASNVWWSLKRTLVNNWNAVCNGGIGMAALAIGDEEPEIAGHILEKAIPSLERGILTEFVPDGGWGEGPGYWRYTIEYVVSFLASLESAIGKMYGMEKTPGLKETAYFPIYLTGPNGSFNYADATSNKMKMPELFWLANQLNDPEISASRLRLMEEAKQNGSVYDLIWYRPQPISELNLPLDKYFRGVEVVTMRSHWDNPYAQFVGFKGGKGYTSHGHLDIGNFVYQANGETWAEDLGSDNYANGYFDYHQKRFHFYRAKPEGHNTLVINPDGNYQQNHETENTIIQMQSKPKGAFAILDMSGAYNKNALYAKRGIFFTHNREQLVVQDEVSLKGPSNVYWFMHTLADVSIEANGKSVLLTKNGQKLWLEIISPNKEDLYFQAERAKALPGEPIPSGQKNNENYTRIHILGHPQAEYKLSIAMIPLKYGENKPASLPVFTPMENWQIEDGEIRRPELSMIYLDGKSLPNFSPEQHYYSIALPSGTKRLPIVTAESSYDMQIKKAESWLDDTVITVNKSDSPDDIVRYVLKFHVLPGSTPPSDSRKLPIKEATASTYQNEPAKKQVNPPVHAIDGLTDTRWAAEGNQWICLELNHQQLVDNISIAFARGNARIFRFDIESSLDGDTWKTLYKGANSGTSQEPEYFSLEPTLSKFIRIQGQGNSQNNWNTYNEVEVWGNTVVDAASRSALEVLIASGSSLQLTDKYSKNTPEKKAKLDQAMANASSALTNPILTSKQWQVLFDALATAIALIKETPSEEQPNHPENGNNPDNEPKEPEKSEPAIPYVPPFSSSVSNQTSTQTIQVSHSQDNTILSDQSLTSSGKKLISKLLEKQIELTEKDDVNLRQLFSDSLLKDRKYAYFSLSKNVVMEMHSLALQKYSDITHNTWYDKELAAVSILNLVKGYPDGSFGGHKPISGQEFITLLLRLDGFDFQTKGNDWFIPYQNQAEKLGLLNSNITLSQDLTREEVAFLLTRIMQKNNWLPNADQSVIDINSVSPEYQADVNFVYSSEIMQGYPKGNFQPKATITRSEIVAILYRLLQQK